MKAASSVLFLCILLSNLAGIPVAFSFHQARIRREIKNQIKAGIPPEQLHRISFSSSNADNIHWTRKDKEFRLDNQMYDIVFSKTDGDSVHHYCINDREEKQLHEQIRDLEAKRLRDNRNSQKNPAGKLLRAITSLIYIPAEAIPCFVPLQEQAIHFMDISRFHIAPFLENSTPPPRFA